MMGQHRQQKWLRLIALFLVGAISPPLFINFPDQAVAQAPGAGANSCAEITNPLTPEEETYARTAWQYFLNNYQPETGFTNSTGGYPSGTLWDMGNYLMALNAARWLNLIDQADFDLRLNKFLQGLSGLRLFEDSLPNKVYNAANGEMVDYGNNPIERGIGWSALDIGRILAAFHVLRTCHPQYSDWLKSIIDLWAVERSIQDGFMFGAMVLPDGQTMPVQEGRLGYEEYAARGYELWGYSVPAAVSFEPFKMVEIYGVQIPVDTRNYQSTNANNYVVSESYILDGIEFGFLGEQTKDYAARVLEVQKRRYQATGQLTAVTEDNIDGPPYFLYNTIFSNGVAWATITENNELHPELRSISTKAAFGWRYIFPDSEYAQKLFEVAKGLMSPDGGGFYAGLYEETNQPNTSLTGNTNGLIMEILYYKARGNRPLIGGDGVSASGGTPQEVVVAEGYPPPANPQATPPPPPANPQTTPPPPPPSPPPATATQSPPSPPPATATQPPPSPPPSTPTQPPVVAVAPIPSVGKLKQSSCRELIRPLNVPERRYAESAWQYFEANYQPETGLVRDRSDMEGATLWGLGDYLAALQAAASLDVISLDEFDQRTRKLLGALVQLPLFDGELPHRGYDIRSLEAVDYGTNPVSEGTGWSGLDVGRMLLALYNLKSCYPQYTDAVEQMLLDWSYLRVIRNGRLNSAVVKKDDRGRILTRVYPVTHLGYEEYAARGFQLWGFDVEKSAVGGEYQTASVEGVEIPTQRQGRGDKPEAHQYTVSNPFLRYGLELGFDPQMRSLVSPMLEAQAKRYRREGIFTASGTTLIGREPYVVHSTIVGQQEPWATLKDDGTPALKARIVSTAAAFAYYALFSDNDYARELYQSTLDLYNPRLGYYEGVYEKTGKLAFGFSSTTNSIILQSLLYRLRNQQPLLVDNTAMDSSWWRAVAEGNSGNGLPSTPAPKVRLVSDSSGTYWTSVKDNATPPVTLERQPARETVSVAATIEGGLTEADKIAAQRAWQYFERNWNTQTGLVNAVENYPWTTLWDQGSAILGTHAAQQLGLIQPERFSSTIERLLQTLETLPLPATGLPNKAYSTQNGEMRRLNNTPDPKGTSGWSALDTARFLLSLHVLRTHHPEYRERINRIVERWKLSQLVKDGWLQGGIPGSNEQIRAVQEGRLGYEQYAAHSLQLWGIEAENALYNPPVKTVDLEGIPLQVDRRNLENSGATNYLTNEPYLLWGLELGWTDEVKPQVLNLLKVQERRFKRTGILTAVNEDSLDRAPHFLYYSVYANGQPWNAVNSKGKPFPQMRFLSTKAAFAWEALMPDDPYARTLREAVENLADQNRGYPSGGYEDSKLGVNALFNVNTNAVILESLLYQARGSRPLAL